MRLLRRNFSLIPERVLRPLLFASSNSHMNTRALAPDVIVQSQAVFLIRLLNSRPCWLGHHHLEPFWASIEINVSSSQKVFPILIGTAKPPDRPCAYHPMYSSSSTIGVGLIKVLSVLVRAEILPITKADSSWVSKATK